MCFAVIRQKAVLPWVGGRKDRRTETDSENMPSSTTCRVVTRDAGGLSGVPVTPLVTRARSDCEPP